ncbi:MAG: sigma-54-dependent Fis family transcriptional regulator, partial [Deltaproteobacteria bacterium]
MAYSMWLALAIRRAPLTLPTTVSARQWRQLGLPSACLVAWRLQFTYAYASKRLPPKERPLIDVAASAYDQRILVVEDDRPMRQAMCATLQAQGYCVESASDGYKALPKLVAFAPGVIISDLRMPGMDGVELMLRAREFCSHALFILLTGYGSIYEAVAAMRRGAFDYLTKPLSSERLVEATQSAFRRQQMERREAAQSSRHSDLPHGDNSSSHPTMIKVWQRLDRVAPTNATVLITGETGVGKELVAHALHDRGPTPCGPFVKVNCAALSESLLESELFGHESGAFTHA